MEPGGDHLELPRIMEIRSPWVLNISTDGDSTASLISPCPSLTNLTVENVFSCVHMQLPIFSSVPIAGHHSKEPGSLFDAASPSSISPHC